MELVDIESDWDEEVRYLDAETQTSECEALAQITKQTTATDVTLIKQSEEDSPTVMVFQTNVTFNSRRQLWSITEEEEVDM
eukprot:g38457.t1